MSFAAELGLLTRVALRAELRGLLGSSRRRQIGLSFLLAFALLAALSIGGLLGGLLSYLPQSEARRLESGILLLASLGLFAGALVTSIPAGLDALGPKSTTPLLLATPIRASAVFGYRLLVSLWWDIVWSFVIVFPLVAALGINRGVGPGYYLLAAILLVCAPIPALALGQLLVFTALRRFSARSVRTVLAVGGSLVGAGIAFVRIGPTSAAARAFADGLAAVGSAELWWAPFAWPAYALRDLLGGSLISVAAFSVATLAAAAATYAVAVVGSARAAETGWLDLAGINAGRRGASTWQGAEGGWLPGTGQFRAILVKDVRLVLRDPLIWTRMVGPLVTFGIVIGFGLATFLGRAPSSLRLAAIVATAGFIAWNINNRLTLTAFNRDRLAVAWTLLSPAPPSSVALAKMAPGAALSAGLCIAIAAGLSWWAGLDGLEAAACVLGAAGLAASSAAISLWAASRHPKFDWGTTERINTTPAVLRSLAAHVVAIAVFALGFGALPMALSGGAAALAGAMVGLAAAVGLSALCVRTAGAATARWEIAR